MSNLRLFFYLRIVAFGIVFQFMLPSIATAEERDSNNLIAVFATPSVARSGASTKSKFAHSSEKTGFGFAGGLMYLIHLSNEKYYYALSLSYDIDRVHILRKESPGLKDVDEEHNLHSVAFSPVGLYLQTDEIGVIDLRALAIIRVITSFTISEGVIENKSGNEAFINEMNFFNIMLNLRLGLVYMLSYQTSASCGIEFNIGFMDVIKKHADLPESAKIEAKTNRIGFFIQFVF